MFRNRRSFTRVDAGTDASRLSPGMHGTLILLASTLTLLQSDASAQARHYPLESTAGLRLVRATAEPATLDGKKGLRVTMAKEPEDQTSPQPPGQRTTGEPSSSSKGSSLPTALSKRRSPVHRRQARRRQRAASSASPFGCRTTCGRSSSCTCVQRMAAPRIRSGGTMRCSTARIPTGHSPAREKRRHPGMRRTSTSSQVYGRRSGSPCVIRTRVSTCTTRNSRR